MKIQKLDSYIKDMEKKAKKKKSSGKRKFGNKHYKNPELLLKNKTVKKLSKEEYQEEWFKGFEALAEQLKKVFNGREGKLDMEDIIDAFSSKKVVKPFITVCEEYLDAEQRIPEVYLFMISEFYLSNDTEIKDNEKEFKKLIKIFEKANQEKIDTLAKVIKKTGVGKKESKLAALQFALLSADYKEFKKAQPRVRKFFRELYKSFNENESIKYKTIRTIMYTCYSKKMHFVISTLLNEKAQAQSQLQTPEEKEVYSIVTNIVLDHMKKMDKDDLKVLLKKYAKGRENNVQVKRRVNLYSGLSEDYSKIKKLIDRLINNGMKRELFE